MIIVLEILLLVLIISCSIFGIFAIRAQWKYYRKMGEVIDKAIDDWIEGDG